MPHQFYVVWSSPSGRTATTELRSSDFAPMIRDTLFEGLITGILDVHAESFCWDMEPINRFLCRMNPREFVVSSLAVVMRANGQAYEKIYGATSLAQIALERIPAREIAESLETLLWEFRARAESEAPRRQKSEPGGVVVESGWELDHSLLRHLIEGSRLGRLPTEQSLDEASGLEIDFCVHQAVLDSIRQFSRSSADREVAGLLLGAFLPESFGGRLKVTIDEQREGRLATSEQNQVTLTGEAWQDLLGRGTLSADRMPIGIWHSHPETIWSAERIIDSQQQSETGEMNVGTAPSGLPAADRPKDRSSLFMSSKDLFLHRHFLSWPFQVSLIVDPQAAEGQDIGLWSWSEGVVCRKGFEILD